MAINTSAIQVGADAMASDITKMSLHSADPGANGTANETSADRQSIACTASGGVVTVPSTNFTGVAASGATTHVGLWGGSGGSTFRGSAALTGDQTANAAGEYTVTSVTITGSAS